MSENPKLIPELQEDLVAYLDGELDEQTTQDIELTLANNSAARQEVEALTRTWELLDELPQLRASDAFTERTLSTIKVADVSATIPEVSWTQRAHRGAVLAVWAAGLAMSAVLGFLLTNHWIPNRSEDLLRELPLIENLHVYTEIDDVPFLRELQKSELFNDKRPKENP